MPGNNGFIWVSSTHQEETDTIGGGFAQNLTQVSRVDREAISRYGRVTQNFILSMWQPVYGNEKR